MSGCVLISRTAVGGLFVVVQVKVCVVVPDLTVAEAISSPRPPSIE